MKKIALIFFLVLKFCSFSNSQAWNTNFGDSLRNNCFGCNPNVFVDCLLPYKTTLFVAGGFITAGNSHSELIAYWKNFHYHPLNSINPNGLFKTLSIHNNKLYAGGGFYNFNDTTNLKGLIVWNGSYWDFVSHASMSVNTIETMQWLHDTLFIGGSVSFIDGINRYRVALFDGSSWHSMEQGINTNGDIYCSAMSNNQLYIGGVFNAVSGHTVNHVARWGGTRWYSLGSGLNASHVRTLYTDTTTNLLYAGGYFSLFGDTANTCIASWNGQQWTRLANYTNNNILSICNYRGKIYAGGLFTMIDNKNIQVFARYNGTGWDSIAFINNTVSAMTVFNDELIVGGSFSEVNGMHATGIARYYEPPDSACLYFAPQVYTDKDTFYIHHDTANVQLYSNSLHGNVWLWNFGDSSSADTARMPLHNYINPGHYTLSLTLSEAHCTKTTYKNIVVLDTVTAVAKLPLTNVELRIYPNPASRIVTIEVSGGSVPFRELKGSGGSAGNNNEQTNKRTNEQLNELHITNQQGTLIKTYPINQNNSKIEINTSNWAKGTYVCSLLVGGKVVKVEKLVVE